MSIKQETLETFSASAATKEICPSSTNPVLYKLWLVKL